MPKLRKFDSYDSSELEEELTLDNFIEVAQHHKPHDDEIPNHTVPFKHQDLFKIKKGRSNTVPILRIVFLLVGSHGDVRVTNISQFFVKISGVSQFYTKNSLTLPLENDFKQTVIMLE